MDFNRLVSLVFIMFTASLFFSNACAKNLPHAIVCEQTYALCTSAMCIPDPKDPAKLICDCAIQQGKSAGFTSCVKRKPYMDQYRATHLVSTFSFEQFSSKKFMTCPKGKPWSNCVDMPCTVDPQNTNHAICLCQLSAAEEFFTFGGSCDSNTCATGFWSGATRGPASDALRNAFDHPVIPIACPIR